MAVILTSFEVQNKTGRFCVLDFDKIYKQYYFNCVNFVLALHISNIWTFGSIMNYSGVHRLFQNTVPKVQSKEAKEFQNKEIKESRNTEIKEPINTEIKGLRNWEIREFRSTEIKGSNHVRLLFSIFLYICLNSSRMARWIMADPNTV